MLLPKVINPQADTIKRYQRKPNHPQANVDLAFGAAFWV